MVQIISKSKSATIFATASSLAVVLACLVCQCQARSAYSADQLGQLGAHHDAFNQFNSGLGSQLNGGEESSPAIHQNQYAREDVDDAEDGADDDGSDGAEATPMRNYAASSAAGASSDDSAGGSDPSELSSLDEAAGEDSDASELSPSNNKFPRQQAMRRQFGSASQTAANQMLGSSMNGNDQQQELAQVNADQQWADRSIDQDADAETDAAASAPQEELADEASANDELGMDTNIANAKIEMTPRDMSTAAGHHYHGHGVHGMLKMGAETGKKGAFKWYDKHPVGGKGRR